MNTELLLKLQSEGCYIPPFKEVPTKIGIFAEMQSTVQKAITAFCQFITHLFAPSPAQNQLVVVGREKERVDYKMLDEKGCPHWYWFISEAPIYGKNECTS